MLRFVPNGAVVGVDGGKPTSRGLPPAALGDGGAVKRLPLPKMGFSRVWTLERVRAEPAVLPAGWWGVKRRREGRRDGLLRAWNAGLGRAPDVRREMREAMRRGLLRAAFATDG